MHSPRAPHRLRIGLPALAVAVVAAAALVAVAPAAEDNSYVVHNIVSNIPGVADQTDANLENGWGLDSGPTTPWWVADNGTDRSTLYTAGGAILPLVVTVDGGPTGLVFNSGAATSFFVSKGDVSRRANFLFASEDGVVRGWNPTVDPTVAQVAYTGPGASYKGLAIASTSAGDRLYAADFANAKVDVLDGAFQLVTVPGAFTDPGLPAGYAPFGIRAIGGTVFVAYAKQDAEHEDEVAGQGLGFVDAYDTAGRLLGRVASRGQLNAPWGLAIASSQGFGRFSGDLLVGNFGDGTINAYEPMANGRFEFRGTMRGADGEPLAIDGLWALAFGHDTANNGSSTTLFFTAGPNDEDDGLFGSISAG
jgi:uncharacterized protein (TIGR03118 family)